MGEIIGRSNQKKEMKSLLKQHKSNFLAVTGRRRVGKTFLIDEVYCDNICLRVTGIQDADTEQQIFNFTQKLKEHSDLQIVTTPENWQQVCQQLRDDAQFSFEQLIDFGIKTFILPSQS